MQLLGLLPVRGSDTDGRGRTHVIIPRVLGKLASIMRLEVELPAGNTLQPATPALLLEFLWGRQGNSEGQPRASMVSHCLWLPVAPALHACNPCENAALPPGNSCKQKHEALLLSGCNFLITYACLR